MSILLVAVKTTFLRNQFFELLWTNQFLALLLSKQAWTPISCLESFPMDSVHDGKANFYNNSYRGVKVFQTNRNIVFRVNKT